MARMGFLEIWSSVKKPPRRGRLSGARELFGGMSEVAKNEFLLSDNQGKTL